MNPTDLSRNLARLRSRHPALAEAVASAPQRYRRVEGPRGGSTLEADGVLVASAYDPQGEAQKLAEEMAREPADLLVAIGFGLGHHLSAYLRRHDVPLLVYEPSPVLLRGALEVGGDFGWIDAPNVDWVRDPIELGDRFRQRYVRGLRVRAFVHPAVLRLDARSVSNALEELGRVKDACDIDAQTRAVQMAGWARRTVDNAPYLLRDPSLSGLFGAFRGVPAVIAAAGPSLDRQLATLGREAERVLVIAIGQSLRSLRRAGIEPDLVHVLDSADVSHQIEQAGDPAAENLVLFPSVHPALYELPVRSRFVAYPATNRVGCWLSGLLGDRHWPLGGATVAQSAVHIAALLGANPIHLIGQDLAFTGGRVYASGSAYDMVSYRETADGGFVFTSFDEKVELIGQRDAPRESRREELIWVEGWGGERVPTSKGYASFIDEYRRIGAFLADRGIRLVNCTEGGARIPGLEQMPFDEALERCPHRPVGAKRIIHARFDAAEPVSPDTLRRPLARAAATVFRLARRARTGLGDVARAERLIRTGAANDATLNALRTLGRLEGRLVRELAAAPWLDALSESELQRDAAALRRADGELTPDRCVNECRMLLRSLQQSTARAQELLALLEARLHPASPCAAGPDDAETLRAEAAHG